VTVHSLADTALDTNWTIVNFNPGTSGIDSCATTLRKIERDLQQVYTLLIWLRREWPRSCHSALTGSRNSGANGSGDPRQCAAYSELPALSSFSVSVLSLPRPSRHLSKRTPLILLARSSMLAVAFLAEYQAGSPTSSNTR
jgi:hypothetical protein